MGLSRIITRYVISSLAVPYVFSIPVSTVLFPFLAFPFLAFFVHCIFYSLHFPFISFSIHCLFLSLYCSFLAFFDPCNYANESLHFPFLAFLRFPTVSEPTSNIRILYDRSRPNFSPTTVKTFLKRIILQYVDFVVFGCR